MAEVAVGGVDAVGFIRASTFCMSYFLTISLLRASTTMMTTFVGFGGGGFGLRRRAGLGSGRGDGDGRGDCPERDEKTTSSHDEPTLSGTTRRRVRTGQPTTAGVVCATPAR